MADAYITVDTKLDSRDFKQDLKNYQKLLESASKKLDNLNLRKEKAIELGNDKGKAWESLNWDIKNVENEIEHLNEDIAVTKKEMNDAFNLAERQKNFDFTPKIDEEDLEASLQKLEKEYEAEQRKLESLQKKSKESFFMGEENTAGFQRLQMQITYTEKNVEALGTAIDDVKQKMQFKLTPKNVFHMFADTLKEFNGAVFNSIKGKVEEVKGKMANFGVSMKSATKETAVLGKSIFSLGKMFKMLVLRMAMRGIIRSIKEGFNSLVQYSSNANKSASALASSLLQLRNSFAVAFEPIFNAVAPILASLIDKLNEGANAIARFFGAFTGQKVVTQAVKTTENYAKALKKANALSRDFDELHELDQKQEGTQPSQMFETKVIDDDTLSQVNELKLAIQPIIDAFNRLKETAQPLKETLGNGLKWIYDNVLLPVGKWASTTLLPKVIDTIGSAFTALNSVLVALQPLGEWLWEELLQPIGEWTGQTLLDALDWLNEKLQEFSKWCDENPDKVREVATVVGIVTGAFVAFKLALIAFNAITTLTAVIIGLLTSPITLVIGLLSIVTIAFVKWATSSEENMNKVKKGWESFKNTVKRVVDAIKGWINGLGSTLSKLDIFGWFGGDMKTSSSNRSKLTNSPRLATGTVIPANTGEFTAILGDNKRETEVVSPLSTIEQAVKNAMAGAQSGTQTIILQVDGRTLAKVVNDENRKNDIQYGY